MYTPAPLDITGNNIKSNRVKCGDPTLRGGEKAQNQPFGTAQPMRGSSSLK